MNKYDQYYFAFLDLLGFKEIVRTKSCSEIAQIFDEAKKRFVIRHIIDNDNAIPVIPIQDIHFYIMSDSICIYIKDNIKSALPVLTWLCLDFQVRMLCLDTPILVRGSISRGDIFEDQNVLFGPAMVDAYLRAEKLAHVPRIIIPENIYSTATDIFDKTLMDGFTHQEQDGFYVINYIQYFCGHNSTLNYRDNVQKYLKKIINTSLDQSVREKALYVKFWMDYISKQDINTKDNDQ